MLSRGTARHMYGAVRDELSQVSFRLGRWKIWKMSKKFDQEAKDRVVGLVEERLLAENLSMQAACQAVASRPGVSSRTA
ncbi:hypothetical protein CAT723_04930 [Corynebacterium ammoniagenes]|uniref:Transposase n=1 Tax=Corynebacterium ammoniagenes TaxID=1697 RepID=A0AAV5G1L6_CORAM|nr:hypothetical protein CAT723_04930 [Corynebacterium ammoniagenes]